MTSALPTPAGERIGNYEILRKLRAGGMATIYLGRRLGPAGFTRNVVLKLVHPHLSQENQFIAMFMDEARISARISHANVVHVEEFGEDAGVFYLVMEHVDGCAVSQLLRSLIDRGEKLPVDMAVHIACKAAAGLHAAHETRDSDGGNLGVVHRDVSPSNVLVSRDGNVKLIDFGVAKARNRTSSTHSSYALKGKLRYMSPEQAWGSDLDRRSDIYSLAIVLWELLAMRPLFDAENDMLLLDKVRYPQVLPPSTFNPAVSPELDAVILRALAVEVEARPATAGELRALLGQVVPGALTFDQDRLGTMVDGVADAVPHAVAQTPPTGTLSHSVTTADRPTAEPPKSVLARRRRTRVLVSGVVAVAAVAAGIVLALAFSGGEGAKPTPTPSPSPSTSTSTSTSPSPSPSTSTSPTPSTSTSTATAIPAVATPDAGTVSPRAKPRKRTRTTGTTARKKKKTPERAGDTPIAGEWEE